MARKYFETKLIHPIGSRRNINALTTDGFKELIKHVCQASAPADADVFVDDYNNYSGRIELERSFAVGATLYINSSPIWREQDMIVGQDDQETWWLVNRYQLSIEINWSGTSRDLISAAAAVDVYQELIKLGNHITVALGSYDLVHLREATPEVVEKAKEMADKPKRK